MPPASVSLHLTVGLGWQASKNHHKVQCTCSWKKSVITKQIVSVTILRTLNFFSEKVPRLHGVEDVYICTSPTFTKHKQKSRNQPPEGAVILDQQNQTISTEVACHKNSRTFRYRNTFYCRFMSRQRQRSKMDSKRKTARQPKEWNKCAQGRIAKLHPMLIKQ